MRRSVIAIGIAVVASGCAAAVALPPPTDVPAVRASEAYPPVAAAECFPTTQLPAPERAKAHEWLLAALDREGLYTVATGLKPISSGIRAFRFSATDPDLAELDEARRIVSAMQCGESLTSFVHHFAAVFKGERSAEIMLVHRPAFDRTLAKHRSFFAAYGLSAGIPPAQALAIVEHLPPADRYRALGYLFGFPDYAVDFFVTATVPGADVGPGKDREFFSVPVFRGGSSSFVWAVPIGHQARPEDHAILDRATAVLSAYRTIRKRFVDAESQSAARVVDLLRAWLCDSSRTCGADRATRLIGASAEP